MEEEIIITPAGVLSGEHRLIERMLELMERELEKIGRGKKPDLVFIDGVIDFATTYAHICHHGKEEGILFDKLTRKNLQAGHKQTMDELVLEHIQHRKIVINLEMAREEHMKSREGSGEAARAMITICRTLVEFYPRHIVKEEREFFTPALAYFSKKESEALVREFWDFDKYLIQEKYLKFMDHYDR